MSLISIIDKTANAIPRTVSNAVENLFDGTAGLAALPFVVTSYTGLCAAQGAGVAYGVSLAGGNTAQIVVAGMLATITPPLAWGARFYYDALHGKRK